MKKLGIMYLSRSFNFFVLCVFAMSCKNDSRIVGTWAFCNEKGTYVEVTFLSNENLVICPESQIDCKDYKYKIAGDSLLTFDLIGDQVSSCFLVSKPSGFFDISINEGKGTRLIRYSKVFGEPTVKKAFVDTVDATYISYKIKYLKRKLERGCLKISDSSDFKIEKMDTVFDDF